MIRFRSPNALQAAVGDSLLEAVLVNSHNGSSAYRLMLGVFRLACLNGMVVAESLMESINIRHTGNVIREVVSGTKRIFAEAPKVLDVIGKWQTIDLAPAEQRVLAESAHSLRFPVDAEGNSTTAVTPEMLLAPRRTDDEGNDLWRTFNRIQENATKGISARATRRATGNLEARGSRAVRSITGDVNLNRALWSLAEKMAEIKTAA
jgi:hypothetical protein